jgi:hypothetical protein
MMKMEEPVSEYRVAKKICNGCYWKVECLTYGVTLQSVRDLGWNNTKSTRHT